MRIPSPISLLFALALLGVPLPLAGDWRTPAPASAQQAAAVLPTDPDRLSVKTASGEFSFSLEIADEEDERRRGLMFRQTMAPDHGMLFDFGRDQTVTMWMSNTPMSLDMVFVRADGTVARIAERTEPFSEAIVSSGEPVAYVLELRAGVSRLIGLKPGDRLRHRLFDN